MCPAGYAAAATRVEPAQEMSCRWAHGARRPAGQRPRRSLPGHPPDTAWRSTRIHTVSCGGLPLTSPAPATPRACEFGRRWRSRRQRSSQQPGTTTGRHNAPPGGSVTFTLMPLCFGPQILARARSARLAVCVERRVPGCSQISCASPRLPQRPGTQPPGAQCAARAARGGRAPGRAAACCRSRSSRPPAWVPSQSPRCQTLR